MLVKVILVFLLAMVALGMIARALGLGVRRTPPRLTSALCPRCGRLIARQERCACGAPPRG